MQQISYLIRNELVFCAMPLTGSKACAVTKTNIITCLNRAMHPVVVKGKL